MKTARAFCDRAAGEQAIEPEAEKAVVIVAGLQDGKRNALARCARLTEKPYSQRRFQRLYEIEEGKPPGAIGQHCNSDCGRTMRRHQEHEPDLRAKTQDEACSVGRDARFPYARRRSRPWLRPSTGRRPLRSAQSPWSARFRGRAAAQAPVGAAPAEQMDRIAGKP